MHKNLFILDFILYLYEQGFIKWPTLRTRIYPCSIIALRMTLPTADLILQEYNHVFGRVVEWLKHRTDDQHGLGSKPTCAILLCHWESPWNYRANILLAICFELVLTFFQFEKTDLPIFNLFFNSKRNT